MLEYLPLPSFSFYPPSKLVTLGDNRNGQLGIGSYDEEYINTIHYPVVPSLMIAAFARYDNSFAIGYDGMLYGCGDNTHGELGMDCNRLSVFSPLYPLVTKVASHIVTLLLTVDGEVWIGRVESPSSYTLFFSLVPIIDIVSGQYNFYLLTEDSVLYMYDLKYNLVSVDDVGFTAKTIFFTSNGISIVDDEGKVRTKKGEEWVVTLPFVVERVIVENTCDPYIVTRDGKLMEYLWDGDEEEWEEGEDRAIYLWDANYRFSSDGRMMCKNGTDVIKYVRNVYVGSNHLLMLQV